MSSNNSEDKPRVVLNVELLGPDGEIRALEDIERDIIERAIVYYGGHMSETAEKLKIGRSTLYRKIGKSLNDILVMVKILRNGDMVKFSLAYAHGYRLHKGYRTKHYRKSEQKAGQ
jgi:hypothetical protein